MFTWIIDYAYSIILGVSALIFPFLSLYFKKKKFEHKSNLIFIGWSILLFALWVILLLWLKSLHMDIIKGICFEEGTFNYKDSGIPQGCYDFNLSKHMGIGWPVTATFWIVGELLYLVVVYFLGNVFKRGN